MSIFDFFKRNNKKEIVCVLKKALETEKVVAVKESLIEFLETYI